MTCTRPGCRFPARPEVHDKSPRCSLACAQVAREERRLAQRLASVDNPGSRVHEDITRQIDGLRRRAERLNKRPPAEVAAGTDAASQDAARRLEEARLRKEAATAPPPPAPAPAVTTVDEAEETEQEPAPSPARGCSCGLHESRKAHGAWASGARKRRALAAVESAERKSTRRRGHSARAVFPAGQA